MPSTSYYKESTGWTAINQMYIRQSEGWRSIKEAYVRTDTNWELFHSIRSSGDAIVGETAAGQVVWEFESSSTFVLTQEEEVRLLTVGGGGVWVVLTLLVVEVEEVSLTKHLQCFHQVNTL